MTTSTPKSRAERMRSTLSRVFSPDLLQIEDDSARHAGHSGAQPSGETHYNVLIVAAAFDGLNRVARSRAVHDALAEEFGPPETGGMHALALTLRTPGEHAKSG